MLIHEDIRIVEVYTVHIHAFISIGSPTVRPDGVSSITSILFMVQIPQHLSHLGAKHNE